MTTDQIRLAHAEHAAWLDVWRQLLTLRAITQEDLQKPPSVTDTPGSMLLACIRKWGNELALLNVAANARMETDAKNIELRRLLARVIEVVDSGDNFSNEKFYGIEHAQIRAALAGKDQP